MPTILILQVLVSLILIVLITLQSKDTSLGSGFSTITQTGFHTKRGPEKMLYLITIIASVIFVLLSVINILY